MSTLIKINKEDLLKSALDTIGRIKAQRQKSRQYKIDELTKRKTGFLFWRRFITEEEAIQKVDNITDLGFYQYMNHWSNLYYEQESRCEELIDLAECSPVQEIYLDLDDCRTLQFC